MKTSHFLLLSAAVATAVLLSSCHDYVGKEKTHPLFVKAGTAKSAGDYQEAARCYEEFLLICPRSSLTHLELGNLYCDNLDDPLRAVYHFQKYLEMNPNDTTNAEDVKNFAETAQKNLFRKLCEEYKNDAAFQGSPEEVRKIRDRLGVYVQSYRKLTNQYKTLVERYKALARENAALKRRGRVDIPAPARPPAPQSTGVGTPSAAQRGAGTATASTSARTATSSTSTGTASVPEIRRGAAVYQVQPGDSLVKIARKHYGSPKYYQLIVEANRGKIGKNLQIRVGQKLVIPALPKP